MPKIARLDETFAADLKRRFDDYRAAFPYKKRHCYPKELQQILLEAYRGGVPCLTLAKTAGVSNSILKLWIHDAGPEAPPTFVPEGGAIESEPAPVVCSLPGIDVAELVESMKAATKAAALAAASATPEATVRRLEVTQSRGFSCAVLTFPSGLRLELPPDACLGPEFITTLAALRFES